MSIDVYWAPLPQPHIFEALAQGSFPEPTRVLQDINDMPVHVNTGVTKCPSFNDTLRNTYAVRSPLYINTQFDRQSNDWITKSGAGEIIKGRNLKERTALIQVSYVFVCELPLEMEVKQATYHINEFTEKTILYGATVDIGRYFRGTECSFHIRNNHTELNIDHNDVLYYVTFKTTEPVRLRKFHVDEELMNLSLLTVHARECTNNVRRKLEYYYRMYENSKYHKKIIKQIKQNLLD